MSQATATARPLRSPARAPRRGPTPAPLRVIPARITTTGSGAFAAICVTLLVTGLIALLVLNTALAKGSIELGELQRESLLLSEAAGNLQEEIDGASASGALAQKASQLGLVRSNERAHIDIATGKISGTAYPASRSLAFAVVTSPTPVAKPKATKPRAATPAAAPAATPAARPATTPAATPTSPAATPSATATGTMGRTSPTSTRTAQTPSQATPSQTTPTR